MTSKNLFTLHVHTKKTYFNVHKLLMILQFKAKKRKNHNKEAYSSRKTQEETDLPNTS